MNQVNVDEELNPDKPSGVAQMAGALKLLSKNSYKAAVTELSRIIEVDDSLAKAYCYRANAHLALGNVENALDDCDTAVKLDPALIAFKANILFDTRHFEKALEALYMVLSRSPEDTQLEMKIAACLLYLHRYDDALLQFDKILQSKKDLESDREFRSVKSKLDIEYWIVKAATAQIPDSALHAGFVRLLLRFGCYREALSESNKALATNPDSATALAQKALALTYLTSINESLKYYESAFEKGSDEPLLHLNYAVVLLHLRKYNAALAASEIAAELQTSSARALIVKALAHMYLGDMEASLSACEKSLEIEQSVWCYLLKSIAENKLNKLEDALASVTKLMRLTIHNNLWFAYRACILFELNRLEEAAEDVAQASRPNTHENVPSTQELTASRAVLREILAYWTAPLHASLFKFVFNDHTAKTHTLINQLLLSRLDSLSQEWWLDEVNKQASQPWLALTVKGLTLHNQPDRFDEAMEAYNRAIALKPVKEAPLCILRANLHYKLDCYKDAVVDCDQAISLSGKVPSAVAIKARALAKLGKPKDAKKLCDEGLAVSPNDSMLFSARAHLLYILGETSSALKDSEKAVSNALSATEMKQAFLTRATILAKTGNPQEALTNCDLALAFDSDCYVARTTSALVKAILGRSEEAMRDIESALSKRREYPDAFIAKAHALMAQDNYDDALAAANQAIELTNLDPEYYQIRYQIRKALGDETAFEDATRARDLGYLRKDLN